MQLCDLFILDMSKENYMDQVDVEYINSLLESKKERNVYWNIIKEEKLKEEIKQLDSLF